MEEPQPLTVTNAGQPLHVSLDPVDTYEDPRELTPTPPTNVTVDLTPVE
jgi:hypothetical protein